MAKAFKKLIIGQKISLAKKTFLAKNVFLQKEYFCKKKSLPKIYFFARKCLCQRFFRQKKLFFVIGSLLALPMFTATWSTYFVKIPSLLLVGDCFGILFFAFAVVNILSFVFEQHDVTTDVIYGAIVVYLLIAMMWALIFSLVESLQPGSFTMAQSQVQDSKFPFYYYSFVTITTLGYGDITPVTDIARSFAFLEAVIGQIYLVVLVARLVGINISQSIERRSR